MNFNERGNIPSCSSLGRIRNCGGSWALSRGAEDTPSVDAEKGNVRHDALKNIILGKLPNPQTEEEQLAWKLWGHIQKAAFSVFRDEELVWRTEERMWMSNDELEPILSGQYDVLCHPKSGMEHGAIIFDCKTGWMAGDVPHARDNPQMQGMAMLFMQNYGYYPMGSIVREWAADEPYSFKDEDIDWVWHLAISVHAGEYDVWHKAGLRTGEQCRFCPAKGNCPAYRDAFTQIVIQAGEEPFNDDINAQLQVIGPANLVRILRASPMAEKVIAAAEKEARRRRAAGDELPGVFWEKGNKKREISDPTKFGMKMLAEGVDLGAFQKTEMPIGPAYEAWLKKKDKKDSKTSKDEFNRTFADCISTSENAPSLTFES